MSIEDDIRKIVENAVDKAVIAKGNVPGMPIFGLLVGAPFMKSREATLIDSLLGMLIGSMTDRGDTDAQIMAKCQDTLRKIRAALADHEIRQRALQLSSDINQP